MSFYRRQVVSLFGAALFAGALGVVPAQAQGVDMVELAKPGPLGDKIQGSATAPVTIIEYASLTCPHCAHFHSTVYPSLKKNYIDTGKVRFIFREFPRDPVDVGAFMLARCAPGDKYFPLVDVLFDQQQSWAFTRDAVKQLLTIAKQAGFSEDSFNKCLEDKKLAEELRNVGRRAYEKFKVDSTPTVFINGEMFKGEMTPAGFDKALAPLTKG